MTPEDRELLHVLRRQQTELRRSLEQLDAQLTAIESRSVAPEVLLPPVPLHIPVLPPVPAHEEPPVAETFQATDELPPLPPQPPHAPPPPFASTPPPVSVPFEFQLGKWLTRIGGILVVLTLILAAAYFHRWLGRGGILGLMGLFSVALVAWGSRMEKKKAELLTYGRTILAIGLAGLYVTFYSAVSVEALQVIHNPLLGGVLLLLWSVYVLILAERKHSQLLAFFAIGLAYFSSSINPMGRFTLAADLLLAATAVVFLLRNGWTTLSYFALVGTYYALLRRLVIDGNGDFVADSNRALPFWPHAVYLIAAWIVFTLAVTLANSRTFRGGKRLTFLTLNNAALAGLLSLTAYLGAYSYVTIGWILLDCGVAFIATSWVLAWTRIDSADAAGAYLAQGVALITGGLMTIYSGMTRSVLLLIETLFLSAAGTFSRSRILLICSYVAAFFATLFLLWQITVNGHYPWLIGIGGAGVMLISAWLSRREIAQRPLAREQIVLAASYYCTLAVGLLAAAMATELHDETLPGALAVTALILTFSVYVIRLFELPPIAQTLLLAAQGLILFGGDSVLPPPLPGTLLVAASTLLMITWWSQQRVTRVGGWIRVLNWIYALALVALLVAAIQPRTGPEQWLITCALLSLGFAIYGAITRVWPIAVSGQIFLGICLMNYFGLGDVTSFIWSTRASVVTLVTVFATGRVLHSWLDAFPEITEPRRGSLRLLACLYQLLALAVLIRWILAVATPLQQIPIFLVLGTFLLAWNVRRSCSFGVRCSYVLTLLGATVYLAHFDSEERAVSSWLNGFAMLCLLSQAAQLRHMIRPLVTSLENWVLILFAVGMGWLFVSGWVDSRSGIRYLTVGWTLYALFLFVFGLLVREARLRWCGLAILLMALVRFGLVDFLGLSSGFKVMTVFLLALVTLGLGFFYARFTGWLKTWL